MVRDTLAEIGLQVVWQNIDNDPEHYIENVDYTHCSIVRGIDSYSTIDHFCVSQRVYNAINEAGVIHSGENSSNHSAIYLKLKVGDLDLSVERSLPSPRISWTKANSDAKNKYKTVLTKKLNELILPACVTCSNVLCTNHNEELEN